MSQPTNRHLRGWLPSRTSLVMKRRLVNWARTFTVQPGAIVDVDSEAMLIETVKGARRVRVLGSRHSFTDILSPLTLPTDPSSDDVVTISLEKYNRLERLEAGLATVQAGITLRDLNLALDKKGVAMETMGNVDFQTISGAISTGTHGESWKHGSVASLVHTFRLVMADGSVEEVKSGEGPIGKAVPISMGLLGAISKLVLVVVPKYTLSLKSFTINFDELVQEEKWEEVMRGHEYAALGWFPNNNKVAVEVSDRVEDGDEEIGKKRCCSCWPCKRDDYNPARLASPAPVLWVTSFGLFIASYLSCCPPLRRAITSLCKPSTFQPSFTGPSYVVIANKAHINVKHYEMEVAFPFSRALEVLRALTAHFNKIGFIPTMPIGIRCQKKENFWLSGSNGRLSVWLDFTVYRYGRQEWKEYYDGLRHIIEEFDGRLHWGKMNRLGFEGVTRQYPDWAAFRDLCREKDPQGKFWNEKLVELFQLSAT